MLKGLVLIFVSPCGGHWKQTLTVAGRQRQYVDKRMCQEKAARKPPINMESFRAGGLGAVRLAVAAVKMIVFVVDDHLVEGSVDIY